MVQLTGPRQSDMDKLQTAGVTEGLLQVRILGGGGGGGLRTMLHAIILKQLIAAKMG